MHEKRGHKLWERKAPWARHIDLTHLVFLLLLLCNLFLSFLQNRQAKGRFTYLLIKVFWFPQSEPCTVLWHRLCCVFNYSFLPRCTQSTLQQQRTPLWGIMSWCTLVLMVQKKVCWMPLTVYWKVNITSHNVVGYMCALCSRLCVELLCNYELVFGVYRATTSFAHFWFTFLSCSGFCAVEHSGLHHRAP